MGYVVFLFVVGVWGVFVCGCGCGCGFVCVGVFWVLVVGGGVVYFMGCLNLGVLVVFWL